VGNWSGQLGVGRNGKFLGGAGKGGKELEGVAEWEKNWKYVLIERVGVEIFSKNGRSKKWKFLGVGRSGKSLGVRRGAKFHEKNRPIPTVQ